MRIRTLKWHAIATQSSAKSETRRIDAGQVVAELDDIESGLQSDGSEARVEAAERRVDEIGGRFVGMGSAD